MAARRMGSLVLALLFASLLVPSPANAIRDQDNQGRWESAPTWHNEPDKPVPGFLVNLGPTGARARLTSKTFIVRYIFKDSPTAMRIASCEPTLAKCRKLILECRDADH